MRSLPLLVLLLAVTGLRAQVVIPEGGQNMLSGIWVVTDSFTNKGALWLSDSALFLFQGKAWQEDRAQNTYGLGLVVFDGAVRQQVGGNLRLYRMTLNNSEGVELAGSLIIDSALHLLQGLMQGKNLNARAASWLVRTGGSLSHAPSGTYNVAYPLYQPIAAGAELEGEGLKDVQVDNIAGVSLAKNLQASGRVSGTGTLAFNGTAHQTLKAGAGFSLGQLFVQNAAGLGLLSPGMIGNMLRLDGGKLYLLDQALTLGGDAMIEGHSSNHYVVAGTENGRLRRSAFAGSQVFPVGTANHYLPVTVTHDSAAAFGVGIFQGLTLDGKYGTTAVASKQFMVDAVWITEAPATGSRMRVVWAKELEGSRFADLDNEQVGVWLYQNSWRLRNTPSGTVWRQGTSLSTVVSGNSRYAVGVNDSIAPLMNIPLQGKVVLDKSGVSLNWTLNPWRVRGGTIYLEHSPDGVHFQPWYQTTAVGIPLYTHVHQIPIKGINYYRVMYESAAGVKVYSNIAVITYLDSNDQLEVFPNPTTGPITLRLTTLNAGSAPIRVYNMLGQLVQTGNAEVQPGVNTLQADLGHLPPDTYLIKVRNVVVKVTRLRP